MNFGGRVLYALLCGGDYDGGLDHFGMITAQALARTPFGDQLVLAYRQLRYDASEWKSFIKSWKDQIAAELECGGIRYYSGQARKACAKILRENNTFPSLKVLGYYIDPITSYSPDHLGELPTRPVHAVMDLAAVKAACMTRFGWNFSNDKDQSWLVNNVLPGLTMQALSSVSPHPCLRP
jgi:Holliday junction resolvase YEN1